jgi:hypothetical protein
MVGPEVLKRIVRAKYVFGEAKQSLDKPNEMAGSISLLLMHDAVELLMIVVLDHLNVAASDKREFMEFWPLVKSTAGTLPPDKGKMQAVNKARIALKHHGVMPDLKEIQETLPRVEGFFDNVLREYCDIDFMTVSLIDALTDFEVRELIKAARDKFIGGEKASAMAHLALAFAKVQEPEGQSLALLQPPPREELPQRLQGLDTSPFFVDLLTHLELCTEHINALILGVDRMQWINFWIRTPQISWTHAGRPVLIHQSHDIYEALTETEFEESVDFLIDFGIRASSHYFDAGTKSPPRIYKLEGGS